MQRSMPIRPLSLVRKERHVKKHNTLSYDFNPRELVFNWNICELSKANPLRHTLDAIYVPTKSRPQFLEKLLPTLPHNGSRVYLLPTTDGDLPQNMHLLNSRIETLNHKNSEFVSATRNFRSKSNPRFSVKSVKWDLPLKRNFALWHAIKNGFHHILLLDDDIRGLTEEHILASVMALSRSSIVGFYVDNFPDTSAVGHVKYAVGVWHWPFLSGSCLFLRIDEPLGPFPSIYNEDWIFMAPEIAKCQVSSMGSIWQEPYDPFRDKCIGAFQEPGEIIADGLFALLAARQFERRFESSVWDRLLTMRQSLLRELARRTYDSSQYLIVDRALHSCERIGADDCVDFIRECEHDRLLWMSMCREMV